MEHLKVSSVAVAIFCAFGAACTKKPVTMNTPPPPPQTTQDARTETAVSRTTTPAAQPAPVAQAPARSAYPDAATRARIDELLAKIQDAYFDYNRHTLNADAVKALDGDSKELAVIMSQYPTYKLRVEGYCDERGSAEYNVALGEARAEAAKNYLVSAGVSETQLSTVSFGKEKQVCDEHDEGCWSKNRRVHIVALPTAS